MGRLTLSSLRVRLLLLVLVAVVPALALIFYTSSKLREQAARDAHLDSLHLVRTIATEHERVIESAHQLLVSLANLPQLLKYESDGCSKVFANIARNIKSLTALAAVKPNGDVFCSSTPRALPVNFSDRPYFQEILKTRNFTVSGFTIGRLSKKPIITLSYPSLDDGGDLSAVVVIGLDLSWFHKFVVEARLPPGSNVTVIDRNGVILARDPDPDNLTGKSVPEASINKTVLARREGTMEATESDGVPRLYAFTSLRGLSDREQVYVWAGIPKTAVFAEANRVFTFNIVGLGFVAILTLTLAWTGSNTFVLRQVHALISATKRISRGEFGARAGASYDQGEFGELARSFDGMADALEKRYHQLKALHEIDRAISSTLALRAVLDVLLETIDRFLPYSVTTVRLVNKETGELESFACRNVDEREWKEATAKSRGGIQRMLPQDNSPVIVRNAQTDSRALSSEFIRKNGLISFLRVPLIAKNEILGILTFFTKEEHDFSAEEVEFLTILGGQAAIAIDNARLYEETERHLKRIEALHEIDKAITSTLELRAVLDLLLAKIEVFLPFPAATTIRLFKGTTGKFENTTCRNVDERLWKAQVGRGTGNISREILKTRAPVVVQNIQTDPQRKAGEFYRNHGFVSLLAVPMVAKEEVLGILSFYTKTAHEFTQQETEFLQTLAGQAAIAIHNSQLYEGIALANEALEGTTQYLHRSLNQLEGLYTALAPIDAAESAEELIDGIIDRLMDATGADAAMIRLWDRREARFSTASQRNLPENYLERVNATSGGEAVRWVIAEGQPIVVSDIASDSRLKGKIQLQLGFHSCAMLPLKVHNEVRGVMHIASRKVGYFDEEQRDQLLAIARQMGIALENRQLYIDLKSSRDELKRANKGKDEFLGVISHELRTPLNVIKGYTAVLKDEVLGEVTPEQSMALGKIMHQSNELLSMINSVLQVARIEAEAIKAEWREVDLGNLLNDLRMNYDFPMERNLTLNWDYPSDLPFVKTDDEKLKHVLQNLINNAIKFTEKGTVTISARHSSAAEIVEFRIADTGIGIPKDKIPGIFDMFRQVDSSETRSYGGVGIGLYIVKMFTELLRGTVEVESEPGKGSTFIILLPGKFKMDSSTLQHAENSV